MIIYTRNGFNRRYPYIAINTECIQDFESDNDNEQCHEFLMFW